MEGMEAVESLKPRITKRLKCSGEKEDYSKRRRNGDEI